MSLIERIRKAWSARMLTATSDQLTAPRLRQVIWIMLAALWGPVVLAAAPVAADDPGMVLMVSPLLLGVAMFLSTLSGLTALLIRIDRELSAAAGKPLPHPWIFCGGHMGGSWMAGTLMFFTAQDRAMGVWAGLGLVVVGSFAGAKLIELAAERLMGKAGGTAPDVGGAQ